MLTNVLQLIYVKCHQLPASLNDRSWNEIIRLRQGNGIDVDIDEAEAVRKVQSLANSLW